MVLGSTDKPGPNQWMREDHMKLAVMKQQLTLIKIDRFHSLFSCFILVIQGVSIPRCCYNRKFFPLDLSSQESHIKHFMFCEPTLRKLAQIKLLCNPISSTLCDFTLGKLNQETEFYITKHTPLFHTGTPFSVTISSSGTNRVSDCHSSLLTTSSSRWILDKPKIVVTKALVHHTSKNGEHFYGENFIHEYPKSWRHIMSIQNMGTHHTFNNCVRETFNHGLNPSEVDWGDAIDVPVKHGPKLHIKWMYTHGS